MQHSYDTIFTACNFIFFADPETSIQEQALALVRNLVDGPVDSVEYVFAEEGLLLNAIGRQLQSASKVEVLIQVRCDFSCSLCLKKLTSCEQGDC